MDPKCPEPIDDESVLGKQDWSIKCLLFACKICHEEEKIFACRQNEDFFPTPAHDRVY